MFNASYCCAGRRRRLDNFVIGFSVEVAAQRFRREGLDGIDGFPSMHLCVERFGRADQQYRRIELGLLLLV